MGKIVSPYEFLTTIQDQEEQRRLSAPFVFGKIISYSVFDDFAMVELDMDPEGGSTQAYLSGKYMPVVDDRVVLGRVGTASGRGKYVILQPLGSYYQIAVKPALTSRTSTTLVADNDLSVELRAQSRYKIAVNLIISSFSATPDLAWRFNSDSATWNLVAGWHWAMGAAVAAGNNQGIFANEAERNSGFPTVVKNAATMNGVGFDKGSHYEGIIDTNDTAGTLLIAWGQGTLDAANATTVHQGSYLEVTRIGKNVFAT